MGTGMTSATGTADAQGTITLTGTMDEPVTGEKDKKYREVLRWTGPDAFTMEMYDTISGKEVKVMELLHTRAK
jgi:hypothetical protein